MRTTRRCPALLLALTALAAAGCAQVRHYNIYWGDVHGHTKHSDGRGSYEDYFTHARDVSGLDFVIVTDHDFGNGPPWRMPVETWRSAQEKADDFTEEGRFVAIAGYEWTSQPKYWKEVPAGEVSESLYEGPPRYYNHKNVYFPSRVPSIFSAKDFATRSPDLLAEAVGKRGGLIHNNHPTAGPDGRDQWDYDRSHEAVITNTEIGADTVRYEGKTYQPDTERVLRELLSSGRKTGFVKGTDTHEGRPAARTAVLATELTRGAIFEALRHRRNYAVSNARIIVDFRINGHYMGEEIEIEGKPRITARVEGTDRIDEIAVIKDGAAIYSCCPAKDTAGFEFVDESFQGHAYYYLRVIQADRDEHGNRSRAWSSPIWVKEEEARPGASRGLSRPSGGAKA